MQSLLQPRVLNQAAVAGVATAAVCYPRVALWLHRPGPLWYLEAVILVCSLILWGFVFAWHTPGVGRPVFTFPPERWPWVLATATGVGLAGVCHGWLDPALRAKFPEEYPADLNQWLATVPFALALGQLFLTFACFDWLLRLVQKPWLAMALTGVADAGVQALKLQTLTVPLAPWLVAVLLTLRLAGGVLAAGLYWRGGVPLVWWWSLLFQSRLLLDY